MNPRPTATRHSFLRCRIGRGFTLIELLTVIAIIAVLAAIIVPTVGRARRSANDSRCKASMRSLGVALQLYVDDHKQRLPKPDTKLSGCGRWFEQLMPYYTRSDATLEDSAGKDILCPSSFYTTGSQLKNIGTTYGWNAIPDTLGIPYISAGLPMSSFSNPSRTIVLGERWGKNTGNARDWDWNVTPPWITAPLNSEEVTAGSAPGTLRLSHNGRSNYVFLDGHVASFRPQDTCNLSNANATPNLWKGL